METFFPATCPRGWFGLINGSCYSFSDTKLPWDSAKSACEKSGGWLAALNTETEQESVTPYVKEDTWIGLHMDPKNTLQWLWVDGSSADYTNWADPPDKQEFSGNCIKMYGSSSKDDGEWTGTSCSDSEHYVCEISGKIASFSNKRHN